MGGKKKCFINLYFQSTLQICNLNTFVLEKDFEYSPFLLTKLEHDSMTFLAFAFSLHTQMNTEKTLIAYVFTIHSSLFILIHYSYIFICIHYLYVFIHIHYFTWKSCEIP